MTLVQSPMERFLNDRMEDWRWTSEFLSPKGSMLRLILGGIVAAPDSLRLFWNSSGSFLLQPSVSSSIEANGRVF